jgi:hypothetical protein
MLAYCSASTPMLVEAFYKTKTSGRSTVNLHPKRSGAFIQRPDTTRPKTGDRIKETFS